MARVTKHGLSGAIGNVIFYSIEENNYARSKGRKPKKKRGQKTKPENDLFGKVSNRFKSVFELMKSCFFFKTGISYHNAIRGWVKMACKRYLDLENWELSTTMGMCQLNKAVDLRDFLYIDLKVEDRGPAGIAISLPEIIPTRHFKAPPQTYKINLKLIAASCSYGQRVQDQLICIRQLAFIYDVILIPAQEIILDLKAIPGDIAIVTVAVEYQTTQSSVLPVLDKRWLPAAAIAIGRIKKDTTAKKTGKAVKKK